MSTRLALRRSERTKLGAHAILGFNNREGTPQLVRAKIIDISREGACVETDVPVETRSYVQFRVEKPRISGTASVRYCNRRKLRYAIGLEFTGGMPLSLKDLVPTGNPAPESL
jgi:hypothetical protein